MSSIEFSKYLIFKALTAISLFIGIQVVCSAQVVYTDDYDSAFISNLDEIEEFQSISTQDPNKAAVLSAILPGLGQAYNRQFWKIPIIYGGAVIIGHFINYNHQLYHAFRNSVIAENDNLGTTINYYEDIFSSDALERNRDNFRRDRDFLIIIGAAYYLLNIVDAHVSAHLKEFDINDNLSMNITPSIQTSPVFSRSIGFTLALNIK